MSALDFYEIRSRLEEYIKHNEKSNNDLNLRLNEIETKLNDLPKEQYRDSIRKSDCAALMSNSVGCYFSPDGSYQVNTQSFVSQDLEALNIQNNGFIVSEIKPSATLLILILTHFDVEKAFKKCLEIAKTNNSIFNGIFGWNLNNPSRSVQNLNFTADVDAINNITEKIKQELNLNDNNILRIVQPVVRPQEKLPSTDGVF